MTFDMPQVLSGMGNGFFQSLAARTISEGQPIGGMAATARQRAWHSRPFARFFSGPEKTEDAYKVAKSPSCRTAAWNVR